MEQNDRRQRSKCRWHRPAQWKFSRELFSPKMIHLYIAYYNQPRPALRTAFRTKNRLLPYQPHCEPHSVRKTAPGRTNRAPYRIWLNFIHNTYSTIHLPMPPAAKLTTPLYTKKPAKNHFLVGLFLHSLFVEVPGRFEPPYAVLQTAT